MKNFFYRTLVYKVVNGTIKINRGPLYNELKEAIEKAPKVLMKEERHIGFFVKKVEYAPRGGIMMKRETKVSDNYYFYPLKKVSDVLKEPNITEALATQLKDKPDDICLITKAGWVIVLT